MAYMVDPNLAIQKINAFGDIAIGKPTASFKNKTNDIDTLKSDINTYLLSILASLSNSFLLPTV